MTIRPPKRRRIRVLLLLLAALVVLVAAFPSLAAREPLRTWMLRAVLPKIHGSVSVGAASLGWLSPIRFEQIEIRSPDGVPTVIIPLLAGDRPLWRYLVSPRQLGNFRIERPQVNIVARKEGSNLAEVFSVGRPAKAAAAPPDLSMGLEIVDAGFSFRALDSKEPWSIGQVNLALALEPSSVTPSRTPELVLRKGNVLRGTAITPAMCRDLLKYAAPVLAGVSETSGRLSLDLDEWRIPLAAPQQARGSGRLTVHAPRARCRPADQVPGRHAATPGAGDPPDRQFGGAFLDGRWPRRTPQPRLSPQQHDGGNQRLRRTRPVAGHGGGDLRFPADCWATARWPRRSESTRSACRCGARFRIR